MTRPPLHPTLFDLDPGAVWAMHCGEGPVPKAAIAAARAFLDKEARPWELSVADWLEIPGTVRREAAKLFGARAEDFSITGSTSAGLSILAQSFPWQPGDEVVAPLGEFPSNVWPWKALASRGVGFREVPLWDGHASGTMAERSTAPAAGVDPELRLLDALMPKTRILTVSWVRFQDGLRLDLGRLARGCAERGVALVVDGIQGAGTLPLDLDGVAAFATGVHKGLLAPQGLGLLWTAPGFRQALRPLGSWLSVEGGDDLDRPFTDLDRRWLDDGRKFEQGGMNGLGMMALIESLRLLTTVGTPAIAAHIASLTGALLGALTEQPIWRRDARRLTALAADGRLGSIVSLHHDGRGEAYLRTQCNVGHKQGVHASVREGFLRIALHGYHTNEDVERVAAWLGRAV
jgi:cysteine desulfurase / selenocysteine lyase